MDVVDLFPSGISVPVAVPYVFHIIDKKDISQGVVGALVGLSDPFRMGPKCIRRSPRTPHVGNERMLNGSDKPNKARYQLMARTRRASMMGSNNGNTYRNSMAFDIML